MEKKKITFDFYDATLVLYVHNDHNGHNVNNIQGVHNGHNVINIQDVHNV